MAYSLQYWIGHSVIVFIDEAIRALQRREGSGSYKKKEIPSLMRTMFHDHSLLPFISFLSPSILLLPENKFFLPRGALSYTHPIATPLNTLFHNSRLKFVNVSKNLTFIIVNWVFLRLIQKAICKKSMVRANLVLIPQVKMSDIADRKQITMRNY